MVEDAQTILLYFMVLQSAVFILYSFPIFYKKFRNFYRTTLVYKLKYIFEAKTTIMYFYVSVVAKL